MGLFERVRSAQSGKEIARSGSFVGVDQWITDYLLPATQFSYGGVPYTAGVNQTYATGKTLEIAGSLPGHAGALRACPPAFAAQLVRALVLSQARFVFRNAPYAANPRKIFGTPALQLLERPWPNATTGELLSRMEWHAGLAGNSFVLRQHDRLRVLRPDYVAVLWGSEANPDDPMFQLDAEVVGYVYQVGGVSSYNQNKFTVLDPADVVHWSPIPDPESPGMGMSWITPAVRDIQGDRAATEHKLKFFQNGATPNMFVKGIPAMTKEAFNEIVDAMEERHAGVRNAYRTLYLTAGADAEVVGSHFSQIDFKETIASGETRIASLSRVPAPLLGITEGLSGSSLNAGNFGMARRIFADTWVYPTLQDIASALAPIIDMPPGHVELWFDTADIPLLREDAKDAAEIVQMQAQTITGLVQEGFEPASAVAAVHGQNVNLLKHTGLISVQLQPPGAQNPPPNKALPAPKPQGSENNGSTS